ncbi:MAG: hypothetical protein AB8F78_06320 [Saprospiraceae bacterium]
MLSFSKSEKYVKGLVWPSATLACVFLVFLLVNCASPQPQREFTGEKIFRTTQPSRLFFANTRSFNYYRKRPKGTDLDVYRLRKFRVTRKRPTLVPIIVDAYLKDEAYLFIEANEFPGLSDPITFRAATEAKADTFSLDLPSRKGQLEFATDLYEGILNGHRIGVLVRDTGFVEIYDKRADRAAFQAVFKDYYRLTERI